MDCSIRRSMKAIMDGSVGPGAGLAGKTPKRNRPRTRYPRPGPAMASLLHVDVAQRERVVGRLDQVDVLARRPHQGLQVQRDVGEVVDIELGGLGDHVV